MNQQLDIEKTIREYVSGLYHLSLATVDGAKPWVCEVHFAWDDELNIYFSSSINSRHAQEIEQNPKVSGNIVEQHSAGQRTRCVSFEGMAERLENVDETHPGIAAYGKRHGEGPHLVRAARSEGSARFYKITVSDLYLTDGREHTPPQKFHLPWKESRT